MKKYKKIIFLLSIFLFFACQTTNIEESNNPYEFFSRDFDAYLFIPVKKNEKLIKNFFLTFFKDVDETSINEITKRTHYLYAALDLKKRDFQLIAFGNFSQSLSSLIFTEKNGWSAEEKSTFTNNNGLYVALPEKNIILLSKNSIQPLLETFYTPLPKNIPTDAKELLYTRQENNCHFYFSNGADFIKKITGPFLQIPLDYLFGELSPTESNLIYSVNSSLNFTDQRIIRPNLLLIPTFFQMMPFVSITEKTAITAGENKNILLSELLIDFEMLTQVLGR
ncbi:MAG: hypothetical protein ACRC4W_03560 [Treponemataceae bacterium]